MLTNNRRSKRAKKYSNEEREFDLVDSSAIDVFVEQTSNASSLRNLEKTLSECTISDNEHSFSVPIQPCVYPKCGRRKNTPKCSTMHSFDIYSNSAKDPKIEDSYIFRASNVSKDFHKTPDEGGDYWLSRLEKCSSHFKFDNNQYFDLSRDGTLQSKDKKNCRSSNNFPDFFEEKKRSVSERKSEKETYNQAHIHQNLRKTRSLSNSKHRKQDDIFTDLLQEGECYEKTDNAEILPHSNNELLRTMDKESPWLLRENDEDIIEQINNSKGSESTDSQTQKSFVCLVDQLADLRVRRKFEDTHADRRRPAICEQIERNLTLNNVCLWEQRRDLNVTMAINNMFF